MSESATTIQQACIELDRDDFDRASRLSAEDGVTSGPAWHSIELVLQGVTAERKGRAKEAADCFSRVFELGVPMPALLRQCGRYFKRTGSLERAHHCYSLLDAIRPSTINEFLHDLPADQMARYAPRKVRPLLSRPQPGLYALQPIKRALARELGGEGAAFAVAGMAGLPSGWDVECRPLGSLRDYAEAKALEYDELAPSRAVELPPPPVFGGAPEREITAKTRAFFVSTLADAIVSSKSNFVLAGGRALFDHQNDELARVDLDLDVDPIAFDPTDETVAVLIGAAARSGPALPRALSLAGVHSFNFGHWLMEFLPKALACLGRPGFDSVPILIDEQMIPQHREALELFVGEDHPIVVLDRGQAVRVEELWACSMPTYFPLGPQPGKDPKPGELDTSYLTPIDDEAFAGLLQQIQPRLDAETTEDGPRRIYLARRDSQHRGIVNRSEVEAWFAAQGFELFHFGDLPFREQLGLARGADVIVAPDGSALWTAFFARPGTRVGYLNNPYLEDHWWITLLCRRLGLPLSILLGEVVREDPDYRKFSDYRIDIDRLPDFLNDLLAKS